MFETLDVSAQAGPLAEATARLARLLPARSVHPAHAGVLLRADDDGLLLIAADGEVSARLRVPAVTHGRGEVVVSRRGLAETVAALDVPEIRLVAEGSRLAVRTPGARFALPSLGDVRPATAALPREAGRVSSAALRAAVTPVAGAASREHALPVFTGVRLRSDGDRLSLLATDRYRLASASLTWLTSLTSLTSQTSETWQTDQHSRDLTAAEPGAPGTGPGRPHGTGPGRSQAASPEGPEGTVHSEAGDNRAEGTGPGDGRISGPGGARVAGPGGVAGPEVDVLVPAAILAEATRHAGTADTVTLHAAGDLFGLAWEGGSVVIPTLGDAFPDTQLDRLFDLKPECEVEVDADALAAAVDRASRYAGTSGRMAVEAGDGVLLVRANDPLAGESEETVKASVRGDHLTRLYQARLLLDALRAFGRHRLELRIQGGIRATELRHASPEAPVDLRYLVVPLRAAPPADESGAAR
ncbi:DNA polymerase III subunit beta family protein [Rugosimonospora africana]|uniref:DNA polymerase-3 subunit beta n=1 Tax=Rugosimonospora africana TaxID=556532 RepID=A0A8J3QQS5_9ACTN|nr:hypothetical protein [Rugosimonospora africana]GIH14821.1 hypothetical protein Raf01_29930 [Rugosimonospora africana]